MKIYLIFFLFYIKFNKTGFNQLYINTLQQNKELYLPLKKTI